MDKKQARQIRYLLTPGEETSLLDLLETLYICRQVMAGIGEPSIHLRRLDLIANLLKQKAQEDYQKGMKGQEPGSISLEEFMRQLKEGGERDG